MAYTFFSSHFNFPSSKSAINYKHLLFCLCIFWFASCSYKNKVSVKSVSFDDEVENLQNLIFVFNKNLCPDSLINNWDSSAYINFKPAIKGKFRWTSSHELLFSPAEKFKPATFYTATINNNILKYNSNNFELGGNLQYSFHTADLSIEGCSVFWTKLSKLEAQAQITVEFNYLINTQDIAKQLTIEVGDYKAKITLSKSEISNCAVFNIEGLPAIDKNIPFVLKLRAGTKVELSKNITPADINYEGVIPNRYSLSVQNINTTHDGTTGIITVFTSEEVNEEYIEKFIDIQPKINYKIAKTKNGFSVSSTSFASDVAYLLVIKQGLNGMLSAMMKSEFTKAINFGNLTPSISFVNKKAIYLGNKGNKNIAINLVNVPKVKVTVIKIYENNLLGFLQKGKNWQYHYDDESDESIEYNNYETEQFGDVIYEKVYDSKKLKKLNAARILHFDFSDRIKDKSGIYVVKIQSEDKYWLSDSRVISLSDIGLIVKNGKRNLMLSANSIQNVEALKAVKIRLISFNNQLIDEVITDGSGLANYIKTDTSFPYHKIAMITASTGNDFNYLLLNETSIDNARFEVGGKSITETEYDAFIYAEREIYRPGETMHFSAIIRSWDWQLPKDLPIRIVLSYPNGKEFRSIKKLANSQGALETAIELPNTISTGTYTIELYTANNSLLGSKNISVEEFMPDRIKLKTSVSKTKIENKDSIEITIQADNNFGTPAANRNFEIEYNISPDYFSASQFSDYDFNLSNTNMPYYNVIKSGTTNGLGNAKLFFGEHKKYTNIGLLAGKLHTTVFDENGRPVNRSNIIAIYTQPAFVGIKNSEAYINTKQEKIVNFVTLNKDGLLTKNEVINIDLVKVEWETILEKVGSRYQYNSQKKEIKIDSRTMKLLDGRYNYSFVPALSGQYEIRANFVGSQSFISKTYYAYGLGATESTSFEVENDGTIDISCNKESYTIGDVAKLLFKTPFKGKLLVTLEQDDVIKSYTLNTDNKAAELSIGITDRMLPNVFVSATLIRPNIDGSNPLTVAHGYKNIKVLQPANLLNCQIVAAALSRSKCVQTIVVKTKPFADVTIAVVDEGILQLKNTETPNPYNYFYQGRALGVRSYDIYPYLYPEIMVGRLNKGGGGMNIGKRANPLSNKRMQLVSHWSGIIHADATGRAITKVTLPAFSGDLRIMVVAYKDEKMNAVEAHMKVSDPIVISNGLPRFVSPGDTIRMPITLSNTTKKNVLGSLKVLATGNLQFIRIDKPNISIEAGKEIQVEALLVAPLSIGQAKVEIITNAFGENFSDVTNITVRPASPLQVITYDNVITTGATKTISLQNNFIPSSVSSQVIISQSPLVQFSKDLEYLITYPHGCLEQTISSAFPQLYYFDLAKQIIKKNSTNTNPNSNIQYAITKIENMQLYNGGLSYWLGGNEESWWGSAYAAHFLLESQKAGFQVNKNCLDKLINYLKDKSKEHPTYEYFYNGNNHKNYFKEESVYSLYVLALAGKAQMSAMNFYAENSIKLSIQSKYLLANIFNLMGNKARAANIMPANIYDENADYTYDGSFNSALKTQALVLNTMLECDPQNIQISSMAKQISAALKSNGKSLSTIERSFALLALGKFSKRIQQSKSNAQILVNGVRQKDFTGEDLIVNLKGDSKSINIQCNAGTVYYFVKTEGISATGSYLQEDKYLKVRRQMFNRNGQIVKNLTFKQNELVIIKISVQNNSLINLNNIAISDILPAGFEIENPRITMVPNTDWIKDSSEPDFMDFRDDRVNYFANIDKGKQVNYYYIVRAVAKGNFKMGPVSAEAMYNSEYHSYWGAGSITVK
jgi:uncharacterized repeat protein (TIGR01451 family)